MRGEVEIWDGDNLIHKEPNMLVDGAGELLAEIMTVSPSLSGIASTATSSILDSSNYTIQAISFGTGAEAFRQNAHRSDGSVRQAAWLSYHAAMTTVGHGVNYFVYAPSSTHPFTGVNGYSYSPIVGLPIPPTPILPVLEEDTSISAIVGGVAVSSVFPGNGQLTNFIPSGIFSSVMQNTPFSGIDGLSGYAASTTLGCFMEGSSLLYSTSGIGLYNKTNDDGSVASLILNTKATTYLKGSFFNEVSSMDVSGFVNMVMSGSPGTTTNYAMSSGASGLCVSGGNESANSGTVEYTVMISADDVAAANAYGGIYHLGLWTIDINQSLRNGNTPPFGFSVLNNPRKYKLFSRKGFSKNLCFVLDKAGGGILLQSGIKNYKDLTIKWRLHFI